RMSIIEVNGAGNPHPDEMIQSSPNEQISCSYNRTRSVQYPNKYESASHTPKRNWKKTPDFTIGIDQHLSKLSDNRQETAKVSTALTTTSFFNISHQFKKSSNDSSNRLRRESP
ncbi:unnamed protein product, partial [Rotaria sp. Silwood1]